MSTRRKIGVNTATSEAARRQLMQPVPCWEKVWVAPENAPVGSKLKIYKWVKTDNKQYFSDDEEEVDAPLAPLPDEPEVDDEMDQDEPASVGGAGTNSRAISEPASNPDIRPTPAPPTKPHPLSMSIAPSPPAAEEPLDPSLEPTNTLDVVSAPGLSVTDSLDPENMIALDIAELESGGPQFEGDNDLGGLQATDVLLEGNGMDGTVDPFDTTQ